MMSPEISVIVPTYNRRDAVLQLLDALSRQDLPAERYEVIVSIDGSLDGTREAVEGCRTTYALRCLWQPNQGRAAACNAAIAAARGWLIVIIDDDMTPLPGWLAAHVAAHAPGEARGVLGPVPVAMPPGSEPIVGYIANVYEQLHRRLIAAGYRAGPRDFYTGNFSAPRALLDEIGGFDAAFTIYGNEDRDLWVRLTRRGVPIGYTSEAIAVQHYAKDLDGVARDSVSRGRTAVQLAAKYPGIGRHLRLATLTQQSWTRQLTLRSLLAARRVWPGVDAALIRWLRGRERRTSARLYRWYDLTFDYFFWVGVEAALRERGNPCAELRALLEPERGQ